MRERVEIPTTGGPRGSDGVPGGGLLRRQEWRRGVRRNLDHLVLAGASSRDRWIAQAGRCIRRGCIRVSRDKPLTDSSGGESVSQGVMKRR
jgi:hypothetical protein